MKILYLTPETKERYAKACEACRKFHDVLGMGVDDYCKLNSSGQFCKEICVAEAKRLEQESISPHMQAYLSLLTSKGHCLGFSYMSRHYEEFTKQELSVIIRAMDYAISPVLIPSKTSEEADKIYREVERIIHTELRRWI